MFDVKGLPLGSVSLTRKGGAIRKFLIKGSDGGNEVLTVYSQSFDALNGSAERMLRVRPGDLVFLVEMKPPAGSEK